MMGVTHLEAAIDIIRLMTGNTAVSAADMMSIVRIVTEMIMTDLMIEQHGIQASPAKSRSMLLRIDLMTGIELITNTKAVLMKDEKEIMMIDTDIGTADRQINMTSRKGDIASRVVSTQKSTLLFDVPAAF